MRAHCDPAIRWGVRWELVLSRSTVEHRWVNGQCNRLPALAAELVRRPVSVLVVTTTPAALAAEAATKKHCGVDYQIYRVATLMYSRKSRAVGFRVRFRRVATATVNCCVPRATGSALSDQRLAF